MPWAKALRYRWTPGGMLICNRPGQCHQNRSKKSNHEIRHYTKATQARREPTMSTYTAIPRVMYQTAHACVRPRHSNSRARIQKQTIVIYTAGTLGDHWPFMALGQALTARGYQVRMA